MKIQKTTVKISDIIVPTYLKRTKPSNKKISHIKEYYEKNGKFDEPVVVNVNNILLDGYARYLTAAVVLDLEEVECIVQSDTISDALTDNNAPMTYITGAFKTGTEFTWKLSKNIDVQIGDKVLVNNRKGIAVVKVTSVFTSNDPKMLLHKRVIKKVKSGVDK